MNLGGEMEIGRSVRKAFRRSLLPALVLIAMAGAILILADRTAAPAISCGSQGARAHTPTVISMAYPLIGTYPQTELMPVATFNAIWYGDTLYLWSVGGADSIVVTGWRTEHYAREETKHE